MGASLFQLDNDVSEAVYVNKTPKEIIRNVLKDNQIEATLSLDDLTQPLPYISQGGVSDYDFLLRLCMEFGIVFYYRHNKQGSRLYFTQSHYRSDKRRLCFNPSNGMLPSKGHIDHLRHIHFSLPNHVYVRGLSAENPQVVFNHQTLCEKEDCAAQAILLSHPKPFSSQADCEQYAKLLQAQLDWQREWVVINLLNANVQVADLIQIENHPKISIKTYYRVANVDIYFEEATQLSKGNLCMSAHLISAKYPYQMPVAETRLDLSDLKQLEPTPPCLFQSIQFPTPCLKLADIQSVGSEGCLDERGRYAFKEVFSHTYSQKPELHLDKMEPGAGRHNHQTYGMHWPLAGGTRVILAHTYHDWTKPFILGVLQDSANLNPVVHSQASQLSLNTRSKAGLIMKETKDEQILQLSTSSDSNALFMKKTEEDERVQINSLGNLKIASSHVTTISTIGSLQIKAKTGTYQVPSELSLVAKGLSGWHANSITWQIKHNCLMLSEEGTARLSIRHCLQLKAKQWMHLEGNRVDSRSKEVVLSAGGCASLYALKGLSVGSNLQGIKIDDGQITLQASSIKLIAPQIVKVYGL